MKKAQESQGQRIQTFKTVEAVASCDHIMVNSVSMIGSKAVDDIEAAELGSMSGLMVKKGKLSFFVPASNLKEVVFFPAEEKAS